MARYIDADAFIGKLKTSKDFQEKYATFREVKMTIFFIESVENEPTADVVEAKHGEWVLLDECSNEGVYCSVCHKKVYRKEYANQKVKSNYCPNCGAIMNEEKI